MEELTTPLFSQPMTLQHTAFVLVKTMTVSLFLSRSLSTSLSQTHTHSFVVVLLGVVELLAKILALS